MKGRIGAWSQHFRVKPICKALRLASSDYWWDLASRHDPTMPLASVQCDATPVPQVQDIRTSNVQVYSCRQAWRQLRASIGRGGVRSVDPPSSQGSQCGLPTSPFTHSQVERVCDDRH